MHRARIGLVLSLCVGALVAAPASAASAAEPSAYPVRCVTQTFPLGQPPLTVCIYWPL